MSSPSEESEPMFSAISSADPELKYAHNLAGRTIQHLIDHLQQEGEAIHSVKLSFRDPDESDRLGEDRLVYLWLTAVHYYPEEKLFSAVFFEVPAEFEKWHQVGEQLVFEAEDIFDWMVIREGHLHGGFTLRLSRSRLPLEERDSYDGYIGVSVYEPIPAD